MLFDDPATDEKAKQAFIALAECTRNYDELHLLVAVIRMFYDVKAESLERAEKSKSASAALHLVKGENLC